MTFQIGENVGPYRILRQLGQGGMATVYEAYHPGLERHVAIKVLHTAFMQDANFLARFRREARVVGLLDHPRIVPIYDFSEVDGQPYLVMKFIDGETLKARLKRGPLDKAQALRLIRAVGDALSYAHGKGVLHRDIKPSNILLGKDDSIFLADFGLARIAQVGEMTLTQDMLIGTPQYISPEQARGDPNLGVGTDIYSFGVLAYELVVGRVPFNSDTPFSIIHDHIYSPLPLPRVINPNVPSGMEQVLLKSLAKAPEDRFRRVEDMVEAFCAAAAGKTLPELGMSGLPASRKSGGALSLGPTQIEDGRSTRSIARPTLQSPIESIRELQATASLARQPYGRAQPIWALSGLLLMIAALLAFVLLAGRDLKIMSGEAGASGATPPAVDTAAPFATPAQFTIEDVERADEHWRQAKALMEEGNQALAVEKVLAASELYMQFGGHLEAARILGESMASLGSQAFFRQPRLVDAFTQALFFGAPSRGVTAILDRLSASEPGWDLLLPLKARALLFSGDLAGAKDLLEDASAGLQVAPISSTVRAEILLQQRELERAQTVITTLLDRKDLPAWLEAHLQDLLVRAGGRP